MKASLAEFISVWSLGGEASLNLNTKDGKLNMSFNISLGNPGISIYPSPPTSSAKPRHRGPAEKERGRLRAARHQASKITASKPTPVALVPDLVLTVSVVNCLVFLLLRELLVFIKQMLSPGTSENRNIL